MLNKPERIKKKEKVHSPKSGNSFIDVIIKNLGRSSGRKYSTSCLCSSKGHVVLLGFSIDSFFVRVHLFLHCNAF